MGVRPALQFVWFTAALLLAEPASALQQGVPDDSERYFSEVRNPDGSIREPYRRVYEIYQGMSQAERNRFVSESKKLFQGDNALHPLPRLITDREFETLEKGVKQRGDAIRLFLQDHYSGRKKYLEYGLIPKAVVDRIIARAGESGFDGLVKPEHISFIYGPDIVRAPDGQFHVIEDNPGFVGGLGDLLIAREALYKLQGQYQGAIRPVSSPESFYKNLVSRYRDRASPRGGKVVMYQVPPYPDNEDYRLSKIMADLGVETITPMTPSKLVTDADGTVYVERPGKERGDPKTREKVGFVILNGEHKWIDVTHPVTRQIYLLEEAHGHLEEDRIPVAVRKAIEAAMQPDPVTGQINEARLIEALDRSPYSNEFHRAFKTSPKGLLQSILDGKVGCNYAPGVDFVGDKEFYTYVEDMIRLYLTEEPILKNLPTRRFAKWNSSGRVETDPVLLQEVFGSQEGFSRSVVKTVDGRGGDGVWIGKKLPFAQASQLAAKVRAEPDRFIVQSFVPLSRVDSASGDSMIVDLRLISDVGPKSTYVSPVPWGRGISVDGDGKVNLSASGREFTVIVVPEGPEGCLQRRLNP